MKRNKSLLCILLAVFILCFSVGCDNNTTSDNKGYTSSTNSEFIEPPDFSEIEIPDIPQIVIKTDIDRVEETLIADLLDTFEQAEDEIVDGYISFVVPQSIVKPFKNYLKSNQIEIISNK